MGYGYGPGGIACSGCSRNGAAQGVRKRPCPYGWCPPPALCKDCYKKSGGLRGVHGDMCRDGAAEYAAQKAADQVKLDAGDMKPAAAWGDWQEGVPEGMVGVLYRGASDAAYYLMPKAAYEGHPWFNDVDPLLLESWENNPDVMAEARRAGRI